MDYDLWAEAEQSESVETTQELLDARIYDEGSVVHGAYAPAAYATRRHDAPRPKTALWIAIALAVALAGIYAFGTHFFSGHFFPSTTVNDRPVGGLTPEELASRIDGDNSLWKATVSSGDFTLDLGASDISLDIDETSYAQSAFSQQPSAFAWPAELLKPHAYAVDEQRTHDSEQLASFVQQAVDAYNETASDATPPKVAYDKEKKEFVVTSGEYGTKLIGDEVIRQVEAGVGELSESIELTQDAHVAPADAENPDLLAGLVDSANAIINLDIPITLDGEERTRIGRDEISSWLVLDEQWGAYVSEDAVQEWIVGTLVPLLDYNDKQYAWHVYQDKTRPIIMGRISYGSSEPVEAIMWSELRIPDETPGAREKGRHIDINIDTQYARMYDESGNIIWESYIVTGTTDGKHETPTGEYAINDQMTKDMILIGFDEDNDGEPDYENHVDYWMPFIGGNIGLHDADWRYRFGGEIYTYSGSHGCVNLPHDKAAELYDIVHVGDKVSVHK